MNIVLYIPHLHTDECENQKDFLNRAKIVESFIRRNLNIRYSGMKFVHLQIIASKKTKLCGFEHI